MTQFLSTETLIIALLLIAALVAIVVRRLQIPYTVALVVVGLFLTAQTSLKFDLTPELILALFVPPLIFEAAFHLNFNDLRQNFGAILILAVPGVILTTLLVGGLLALGIRLSLPVALVFGSLIAATDPVAVVSIFRRLGVPKRLAVLIEGESLFNDGTALVLFNLMVGVALTGQFNLLESVLDFVRVAIGGIIIGVALGWVVSLLIARIDDYLIETTLTTVLAFGSFILAEQLHFSGVLAVVAAGLINGNMGPQGMSPTTRIVLFNFWEYVAFLANSLVFLLIGLKVNIPALVNAWQSIVWAILAVIAARILVIYGLGTLANRFGEAIPIRWKHVLTWGGLRGALSLALALSLPAAFGPDLIQIQAMTFGVVLFTLLIQATTMRLFMRKIGIATISPVQVEYEKRHAELTASKAAEAHLERRYREGLISAHTWELLKARIRQQNLKLADAVRVAIKADPAIESRELDIARREILRAKRSAYLGLRRDGIISEEAYSQLTTQVDAILEDQEYSSDFEEDFSHDNDSGTKAGDVDLRDLVIETGSTIEGQKVRHIPWPQDFIITSLQRGEETIIPNGETTLQSGDILIAMSSNKAYQKAQTLCQTAKE